jgi:hypothetical protein
MPHLRSLLIVAAALAFPSLAFADPCEGALPRRSGEHFSGVVRYVGDGDGLCVGRSDDPATWIEVRLADFNAPELSAEGGRAGKAMLERIAIGRNAQCVAGGGRSNRVVSYDRSSPRVASAGDALAISCAKPARRRAAVSRSEAPRCEGDNPPEQASTICASPLAYGFQRLSGVHNAWTGAHVYRNTHRVADLGVAGAGFDRRLGMKGDAGVAAYGDGDGKRDQFFGLGIERPGLERRLGHLSKRFHHFGLSVTQARDERIHLTCHLRPMLVHAKLLALILAASGFDAV